MGRGGRPRSDSATRQFSGWWRGAARRVRRRGRGTSRCSRSPAGLGASDDSHSGVCDGEGEPARESRVVGTDDWRPTKRRDVGTRQSRAKWPGAPHTKQRSLARRHSVSLWPRRRQKSQRVIGDADRLSRPDEWGETGRDGGRDRCDFDLPVLRVDVGPA